MKQYQIAYDDLSSFRARLEKLGKDCAALPHAGLVFYITWTESAQADVEAVTRALEELFPDAPYYGNEASGNIAMGMMTYGVNVSCYVFEAESSRAELVWVEQGTKLASLQDLWDYCAKKEQLRAIELIPAISYIDVLSIDGNEPDIDDSILIFGGGSVNYDDPTFDADIVAKGHPVTREGMAVMLYYGDELSFRSDSVLGWKGLGRTMTVTKSTGKVIREIDGMPAYSIYEKYLDLSVEDSDSLVFPLIVEEDGVEFIRTPQIINRDKSIKMFANIPEGTRVRIAYGDKNTILNSLNDKAAEIAEYRPEAIKAFSCAARRLFWGDAEVHKETEPLQDLAPVCGFYTGGEILRFGRKLRVLNQTLAIVSAREGAAEGRKAAEIASHGADKSLVTRLTFFAEKIVEEERTQRILAEGFESAFSSQYQVMYYIDLKEGMATFLHGDDDARRFLPIFNASSAGAMFANFHRMYVDLAVVEEDRERVKAVMNAENMFRTLKNRSSMSVNFRVRRNLVDQVYTEMRVIKAGEENGTLTAVILAFKLTDEELLNALEVQAKLREDARIIGALSENFGSVYYIEIAEDRQDDTVIEVRASDLLKKMLPVQPDQNLFSMRIDEIRDRLVHESDRKQFHEETRRERILERLESSDTYFVNTRFVIDGEIRYYQLQFSSVRDGGKLTGMVVGIRSVDEQTRKEMEAQSRLEEALEGAEVANRSKTNFLFNMSHDIRTPMNAIKGFTAMAKKYSEEPEKVREYLDKIDISGRQLITLINQVLEMSRIESGKIELDEKPVNVRERFDSMVTVVSAQASAKGLVFHSALEDIRHYNVLADDSRMSQITLNLVGNAIKYTPEGGSVDFRLRELPARKKGYATYVFTVADTGIGMSREYLKELYEPFSREKNSTVSRIQGTGLGMPIVKNIVDLLGGTIDVESEPGKGTRFDVTLDFLIDEQTESAETPVSGFSTGIFEGRRVLLVEDNEMNREIARDVLEDFGFLVEEADDGDVAVDMYRGLASRGDYAYFDFILMDIQMPRMNGYDATREIRAISTPEHYRVPIIAMTANAFEEDRRNAFAAGMDAHLAKPIELDKLLETLAKFL